MSHRSRQLYKMKQFMDGITNVEIAFLYFSWHSLSVYAVVVQNIVRPSLLRDISQDKHKFFCVTLRVRLKFNFFFLFLLCLCTLSIYSSSSSSLFFNVCALSKYKYVHNTHDMKMVEIKCKIGQLNFDIRPFVPSESNFFHSLNFVLFC